MQKFYSSRVGQNLGGEESPNTARLNFAVMIMFLFSKDVFWEQ